MKNLRLKIFLNQLVQSYTTISSLARISNHAHPGPLFFSVNYVASFMRRILCLLFHTLYNIQHKILHGLINHMLTNLLISISYMKKVTLESEPKRTIFHYTLAVQPHLASWWKTITFQVGKHIMWDVTTTKKKETFSQGFSGVWVHSQVHLCEGNIGHSLTCSFSILSYWFTSRANVS